MIEVMVALGIIIIAASASFQVFFGGQKLSIDSANTNIAVDYARQGVEALRNIRARNFSELTDGSHGLVLQNNQWQFASSATSDSRDIFTRTVQVQTVDPNTKIATTTITWETEPGKTLTTEIAETLTNWESFSQSSCKIEALTGDWSRLYVVGSGDLGAGVQGNAIVVRYPYAYLGGSSSSSAKPDLFVFDVSNSVSPSLVSSIDIGAGGIFKIFIKGNYLYAASSNDSKELIIFDISTPTNPVQVGSYDLTGSSDGLSVIVFGNTAAVGRALGASGKQIAFLDVSNPAAPTLIRQDSSNSGDVNDFVAINDRLYVSSRQSDPDIFAYDIGNTANPVLLGSYDIPGTTEDVTLYIHIKGGDINLIDGDTAGDFFEIGATTTATMYNRGSINVGGRINELVCTANDLAFLATENPNQELAVVNVSNPDSLTLYGSLNLPQVGTGLDFANNTLYMSLRSNNSLQIITSQ